MFFKKAKPPKTKHLTDFVERMRLSGVAKYQDLKGCSDDQIRKLEGKYNIKLPDTYREYLRVMGWQSGLLMQGDHQEAYYDSVLVLTNEFTEYFVKRNADNDEYDDWHFELPENFSLPKKSLIINERLGAWWLLITCDGNRDSAVFELSEDDWEIEEKYPSVSAWLNDFCDDAEEAIKSGYFNL